MTSRSATPTLRASPGDPADPKAATDAVWSAVKGGNPHAIDAAAANLRGLLEHDHVRRFVIGELKAVGSWRASDDDRARSAIVALQGTNNDAVLHDVEGLLFDKNADVRQRAMLVLGDAAPARAREFVLRHLGEAARYGSHEFTNEMVTTLSKSTSDHVLPILVQWRFSSAAAKSPPASSAMVDAALEPDRGNAVNRAVFKELVDILADSERGRRFSPGLVDVVYREAMARTSSLSPTDKDAAAERIDKEILARQGPHLGGAVGLLLALGTSKALDSVPLALASACIMRQGAPAVEAALTRVRWITEPAHAQSSVDFARAMLDRTYGPPPSFYREIAGLLLRHGGDEGRQVVVARCFPRDSAPSVMSDACNTAVKEWCAQGLSHRREVLEAAAAIGITGSSGGPRWLDQITFERENRRSSHTQTERSAVIPTAIFPSVEAFTRSTGIEIGQLHGANMNFATIRMPDDTTVRVGSSGLTAQRADGSLLFAITTDTMLMKGSHPGGLICLAPVNPLAYVDEECPSTVEPSYDKPLLDAVVAAEIHGTHMMVRRTGAEEKWRWATLLPQSVDGVVPENPADRRVTLVIEGNFSGAIRCSATDPQLKTYQTSSVYRHERQPYDEWFGKVSRANFMLTPDASWMSGSFELKAADKTFNQVFVEACEIIASRDHSRFKQFQKAHDPASRKRADPSL